MVAYSVRAGVQRSGNSSASRGDQVELIWLSRAKFGLDHAQVGGMLAEHW